VVGREALALAGDRVSPRVRRRLSIAVAAILLAALAAVLAVIALGSRHQPSTSGSLPPGRALATSWSLSPSSHLFGDTVHMRVDATVDRRRLDPAKFRLKLSLAPYEAERPLRRERRDVGQHTHLTYRLELHCIVSECVPAAGANLRFDLKAGKLEYAGRVRGGGRVQPVTLTWPVLLAVSRLDPIDLQRRAEARFNPARHQLNVLILPPWRVDSRLDEVSYAIRPATAFWVSVVAALLLVAAATFLLGPYLPALAFVRRHRGIPLPLERAVEAVEDARASGVEERERKALELLAAELGRSGEPGLAESARALAWSQPDPAESDLTGALTLDVRRLIHERSNGHGD
jgi:hypothetical protein